LRAVFFTSADNEGRSIRPTDSVDATELLVFQQTVTPDGAAGET
jgi:hypothetical protein